MRRNLTIGRGFFRLWIVVSIAWLGGVAWIAWPSVPTPMIHVKFDDAETWDYPAAWGVARIKAEVARKLDEINAEQRRRANAMTDARKAACEAAFQLKMTADRTLDETAAAANRAMAAGADCMEWFFVTAGWSSTVPPWEDQFNTLPNPILAAVSMLAPVACLPPLFLLVVGLALGWAAKGFVRRRRHDGGSSDHGECHTAERQF